MTIRTTEVSDDWMHALGTMHALEELWIDCKTSSVTAAGLHSLTAMRSLRKFCPGANIDDEWLHALGSLHTLEDLSIHADGVTDKGVHSVATLPGLKVVHLHNINSLSDSAFRDLATMPGLVELGLDGGTSVNDDALRELGASHSLEVLSLSHNCHLATDAGLLELRRCRSLQKLYLDEDRHSTNGALALLRLRPGLQIQFGNMPVYLLGPPSAAPP